LDAEIYRFAGKKGDDDSSCCMGKGRGHCARRVQEIAKTDDVAYTTIMTMMQKMEKKGLLEHYEDNRAFVYRALVRREDIEAGMLRDLLDKVFRGSYEGLVNTLVRDRKVTPAELKKLADDIERRKR
jgi:predicted transcriptional regulator